MLKSEVRVQELDNTSIIINELENVHTRKSIADYIDQIKTTDIEKIKFYIGFLYFGALLFFSFTLFF
jgi:hypothetical protein